jgi:hypothetical protein
LKTARNFWLSNALDGYKAVLLLPDPDSHLNALFISALSEKTKNFAVISTIDIDTRGGKLIKTTPEMIDSIISLYSLYRFTDRLIIASSSLPLGEKLQNLLQSGIITMREYAEIVAERL